MQFYFEQKQKRNQQTCCDRNPFYPQHIFSLTVSSAFSLLFVCLLLPQSKLELIAFPAAPVEESDPDSHCDMRRLGGTRHVML